jgi:Fic family protein
LAIESLIFKNQKKYYQVLADCDKTANSTDFIEFSLKLIKTELEDYLSKSVLGKKDSSNRVKDFIESNQLKVFSRKDYLIFNKGLSTATASRDLKEAVDQKLLKLIGEKSQAVYKVLLGKIKLKSS